MNKKGMIIIGYQGIGKSTLSKNGNGYIDLESSNFWIDGKRADDWYIPYCNIAIHLAEQGYIVFTSSHAVVRNYLAENGKEIKIAVCCPHYSIKNEWIKKLEDRYNKTKLEKDYKAWKNAEDRYSENIAEMLGHNEFYVISITNINYDLDNMIRLFLRTRFNNVSTIVDTTNNCIMENSLNNILNRKNFVVEKIKRLLDINKNRR